jgi:hypothetical protein
VPSERERLSRVQLAVPPAPAGLVVQLMLEEPLDATAVTVAP